MELYLFPGGYGGLSLIEELTSPTFASSFAAFGAASTRRMACTPGSNPQRENRHLRQLLDGATPLWPRRSLSLRSLMAISLRESGGLWCIGDQAAVIPSFTGDGISIALHSAALAAQMFLAGQAPPDYNRTLRAQLTDR